MVAKLQNPIHLVLDIRSDSAYHHFAHRYANVHSDVSIEHIALADLVVDEPMYTMYHKRAKAPTILTLREDDTQTMVDFNC